MQRLAHPHYLLIIVATGLLSLGGAKMAWHSSQLAFSGEADPVKPTDAPGHMTQSQTTDPSKSRTVVPGVPAIAIKIPSTSGAMRRAGGDSRATKATPSIAMKMPGVSPLASEELHRISFSYRQEVAQATDAIARQDASAKALSAIDNLHEQYKECEAYPRTGSFIIERKVKLIADDIGSAIPGAEEQLDDFVASILASAPDSEEAATVVGARLYYREIESGHPTEEKAALIDQYLHSYRGKDYADQLVYLYGAMVSRHEGPEARLAWLEKQIENVSETAASRIRRELLRGGIIGSVAELSGVRIDGTDFDLTSLRGKVVLVDFWATWCAPCIAELPHVKKVYDEYRDKGFEVVGFSLDDEREKVQSYLESHEYTWMQLHTPQEERRELVKDRFGVTSIPATYLVDQTGKIRAVNLRGEEQIAEAVSRLLNYSKSREVKGLSGQAVGASGKLDGE